MAGRIGYGVVATVALMAVRPCPAQPISLPDAPPPEVSPPPTQIEEIVVTARRYSEVLRAVPMSVKPVSGAQIERDNLADLYELGATVPGLSLLATPTFNFVFMRGIGSGYNRGFEQSVGIVIDDVYYGRPSYISNALVDLAGVEVLKGPQGTLYGKNSSAGLIHLKSAAPGPVWQAGLDLLGGTRARRRWRGFAGGPAGPTLAWRAAAVGDAQRGDAENTTLGSRGERNLDNTHGRLALVWLPHPAWSGWLTANTGGVDQQGSGTQLAAVRPRHLAAMRVYDPATSDDGLDDRTHQDFPGFVRRRYRDLSGRLRWERRAGTVTVIANHARMKEDVAFDADFSPIPFVVLENDERYRQRSVELRYAASLDALRYTVGAYRLDTTVAATYHIPMYLTADEIVGITGEGEIVATQAAVPDPGARRASQDTILDNAAAGSFWASQARRRQQATGTPVLETSETFFDQRSLSQALFAHLDWPLTARLSLSGGARITREHKRVQLDHVLRNEANGVTGNGNPVDSSGAPQAGFSPGGATTFPLVQPGNTQFSAGRERQETALSPRLAVHWQTRGALLFWLSHARGFKSGGFNAQPIHPGQLEFDAERSRSWELGLRSQGRSGRVRLDLSLFDARYAGLQVAAFDGVEFLVTNAANARTRGLEFDVTLAPVAGWTLNLAGAWLDARYGSFTGGPCPAREVEEVCDLSGRRLSDAPRWQLALTTDIRRLLPAGLTASGGLSAAYESATFFTRDLDVTDRRPANWQLRGRVGLGRGAWQLSLFVSNLTDLRVLADGNDVPVFRDSHFGGRIPATEVELELRLRL